MIDQKIFETTLNIDDPTNFCTNVEAHLLKELENIYVGKCFKNSFILNITGVIQRSPCFIMRTNNSGRGYMHVRFSAVVSCLNAFDLIAAVKIIKNDSNIILGESLLTEPVTIVIPSSESQNNVAEVGQIVPVQLANSSVYYIPGRQQASATGSIFIPKHTFSVYHVQEELTQEQALNLTKLVNIIEMLLESRSKKDFKQICFFEKLYYTYSISSDEILDLKIWKGPKGKEMSRLKPCNVLSFLYDALKNKSSSLGFWARPPNLLKSSPLAYQQDQNSFNTTELPIICSAEVMFVTLLKEIINYLQFMNDLCDTFNNEQLIKRHENIWMLIEQRKIGHDF
ncbi:pD339L [African swine fever virus]|uniref:PD339L n=1 Tax=African swine fever virus TaxID=10497 RepID=A0A6G6AHC4_ASF|nr:pD339L [African swine fever virus]